MASNVCIVELSIKDGSKKYSLPLEALNTSPVLKNMVTSSMREGQTHHIELEEDSAFALWIFVDLSFILHNKLKNQPVRYDDTDDVQLINDDDIFKLRKFTDSEVKDCCLFWNKFQVIAPLCVFLKKSIELHPVSIESFVCMDSMFSEVSWSRCTYRSVMRLLSSSRINETAVRKYIDEMDHQTVRKLIPEFTSQLRLLSGVEDENDKLERQLLELREQVSELQKELDKRPAKRQRK